MTSKKNSSIVLIDDHILFRKGLKELINKFDGYEVIWEASNGKDFIRNIKECPVPEIIMLDIAMPEMDGFETAAWLKVKHPAIKVLVLSMCDEEDSIIRMLKLGVQGFILKDADPDELKLALDSIRTIGFYYTEVVCGTMANSLKNGDKRVEPEVLTEREIRFLELTCTELTYKEIADKMNLSFRSIDNYRDSLFNRLDIKSRVGLALYAIRNGYGKI